MEVSNHSKLLVIVKNLLDVMFCGNGNAIQMAVIIFFALIERCILTASEADGLRAA